jgi:hypothetical protein
MRKLGAIILACMAASTQATRIKNKWMDFDDDVEDLQDTFKVDDTGVIHSLMQSKSSSDPIFPSTGLVIENDPHANAEGKLEIYLRSRKDPKHRDAEEHNETKSSIEWAEKKLGAEMEVPVINQREVAQ